MARIIATLTALLLFPIASSSSIAQSFPSKPITLIVPAAPGGVTDDVARRLAKPLGTALKAEVVIQNTPGGGGAVGLQQLANAPSDGYTLLLLSANAAQSAGPKSFDARKVTFVEAIGEVPYVLAVPAGSALKEARDLFAKTRGKFTIGAPQAGSVGFANARMLEDVLGPGTAAVPFKGAEELAVALRGGSLDAGILPLFVAKQYLDSGQLRALAQTGTKRSFEIESIPTFGQAGFGGKFSVDWYAIIGPGGVSDQVVQALSSATRQALKEVTLKEYAIQPLPVDKGGFATLVDQRLATGVGGGGGETCGSGRCYCEAKRTCQNSPCDACTK